MEVLTPAAIAAAAGLSAYLAQPSWHSASNHVGSPDIALSAISACPMSSRLRLTTASSPPLPAESSSSSCGLPIRFRLLSTLPRGNAVIFSYRALAYPDKDLHLAGCAPSRTHGSPRSGPPSPGSPSLGYFSWRSKRSDPAAGPDTRLGRPAGQTASLHPPAPGSREAALARGSTAECKARRSCCACLAGETLRSHCRGGKPGLGPAADQLLLLRQEK